MSRLSSLLIFMAAIFSVFGQDFESSQESIIAEERKVPASMLNGNGYFLPDPLNYGKQAELEEGLLKYAGVFGGPSDYIDDIHRSRRVKRYQ